MIPIVWAVGIMAGFGVMMRLEARPGVEKTASTASWPADAPLPLLVGRANLVMFAHPRCPCSRASLAEAVEVVTESGGIGKVALTVLFATPSDDRAAWQDSGLWRTAASYPGVRVAADLDGRLAARFGVTASGHVLFFDPAGRLRFSGGITGGRGQEGENAGRASIIALARGTAPASSALARTPVYGCALVGLETPAVASVAGERVP